MRGNTKRLTLSALFTALSVVFLYLASVMPTGQLGFTAVTSLCGVGAVIEAGLGGGLGVFAATSALGFLLIPEKTYMLLYVCFFGYYPVIKLLCERLSAKALGWILKLAVFNAALAVMLFVFSLTVFDISFLAGRRWLIFAVMNVVFVLYDIGVSQVIRYYAYKIAPHTGGRRGR